MLRGGATAKRCLETGLLVALLLVSGCTREGAKPEAAPTGPPPPVQQAIVGGPYPTLILSQAWFWKDQAGKSKPGHARLEIWRFTPKGWQTSRLEDPESNVFHKAILRSADLLTIGAEKAILRRWTWSGGRFAGEKLWTGAWGGKYNRLRDIEIGDVDADGLDEYVIATHDAGVVAVYNPPSGGGQAEVIELDRKPDTFVHEVEIGDTDGDGKKEFFATPSERNRLDGPQGGRLVMYQWDGKQYLSKNLETWPARHAKEALAADLDGDGRDEIYVALEAELGAGGQIVEPVAILRYVRRPDGSFASDTIATIEDRQCRFLLADDFDGDGRRDLIAAPMKAGLYLLAPSGKKGAKWSATCFDRASSGFEHAMTSADLDGDGRPELYVAADDQRELSRYVWMPALKSFEKTKLGDLAPAVFTWNIAAGKM
jgi:hypothetical protein